MKNLLLCVHVVVKTLYGNFTLSFGRLRQTIVLKCVPHVQHDYFSSSNQSDHCFLALSLSLPSSLLKRPFAKSTMVEETFFIVIGADERLTLEISACFDLDQLV